MSSRQIAISICGLSKAYTIAHNALKRPSFRELVMDRLRHPFQKARYETFWALRDVSLDISQGEVVGIIGRNGAGKSTLLKILSRITEPTAGRIELHGRVGSLLEVGTGFHPELTGRENIYLNGAILGMRRAEIRRQFDAILDFAGVEKFLDTPVKRYSSGMYVRLAFAVAAHLEPEILLIDEVLAVGDAEFQRRCLGKMHEVSSTGRTVLFVSHNMAAIKHLCPTAMLFEDGRLRYSGPTAEAVRIYCEPSSAAGKTILSRGVNKDPAVEVEDIVVNGRRSHDIELTGEEHLLNIVVMGQLREALHLDMELSLSDSADNTLAFFSPGHRTGTSTLRRRGDFRLEHVIQLPSSMHRGVYYVALNLTHHNVCYWYRCPRAVRLTVHGHATGTGRPLDYGFERGFFSLEEVYA